MTNNFLNYQRHFRTLSICLFAVILHSYSFASQVKAVASPNADWKKYNTYTWLPIRALTKTGITDDDPILSVVIKNSVNVELIARGMREVPADGDLLVAAFALTTSVPQLEALIFPGGVPLDFATPVASLGRYNREGTLAINLIDSRTNQSAWAGLITQSIDTTPGAGVKKIPKATKILFKKYPVKK